MSVIYSEIQELLQQRADIQARIKLMPYDGTPEIKESNGATRVLQNLDFARVNMKANIYDQAVLKGVATSFAQTEDIIENGQVNGMSATDVQKISI